MIPNSNHTPATVDDLKVFTATLAVMVSRPDLGQDSPVFVEEVIRMTEALSRTRAHIDFHHSRRARHDEDGID